MAFYRLSRLKPQHAPELMVEVTELFLDTEQLWGANVKLCGLRGHIYTEKTQLLSMRFKTRLTLHSGTQECISIRHEPGSMTNLRRGPA
jgi:hypothetical protein